MKKFLLIPLLAMTVVLNPLMHKTNADSNGWTPIQSSAAWENASYRVERVAETDVRTHLHNAGESVFLSSHGTGCAIRPCPRYTLTQLKGGLAKVFTDVPASAFNHDRVATNGSLLYAVPVSGKDNRFDIVEHDLAAGSRKTVIKEAPFSGASNIVVTKDQGEYFFTVEYNFNNHKRTYKQASVVGWDKAGDTTDHLVDRWQLNREELLDSKNGKLLIKMTFETGQKQLWVIDTNVDPIKAMTAVPDSWTEADADIYGAHFLSDGTIEYFQYFTRYTYQLGTKAPVRYENQKLNWFKAPHESFVISQGQLAWVDPENQLRVSTPSGVKEFGTAKQGQFSLEGDWLTYAIQTTATEAQSKSVSLSTGASVTVPLYATDRLGETYVGHDGAGSIVYVNTANNVRLILGTGSGAVLSDATHVYWIGVDGAIYEGTILPTQARPAVGEVRALKSPTSSVVHLVSGDKRWIIPNESVYFSWFPSWNSIELVSDALIQTYAPQGIARFPVGTKVKEQGNASVYVVGADGKLHWIISSPVAYKLYGYGWNQNIVEVPLLALIDYAKGFALATEADLARIK